MVYATLLQSFLGCLRNLTGRFLFSLWPFASPPTSCSPLRNSQFESGILGLDDHPDLRVGHDGKQKRPGSMRKFLSKVIYRCDLENLFFDCTAAGRHHGTHKRKQIEAACKLTKTGTTSVPMARGPALFFGYGGRVDLQTIRLRSSLAHMSNLARRPRSAEGYCDACSRSSEGTPVVVSSCP